MCSWWLRLAALLHVPPETNLSRRPSAPEIKSLFQPSSTFEWVVLLFWQRFRDSGPSTEAPDWSPLSRVWLTGSPLIGGDWTRWLKPHGRGFCKLPPSFGGRRGFPWPCWSELQPGRISLIYGFLLLFRLESWQWSARLLPPWAPNYLITWLPYWSRCTKSKFPLFYTGIWVSLSDLTESEVKLAWEVVGLIPSSPAHHTKDYISGTHWLSLGT